MERDFRANYPGFEIVRQPNDLYVASVLRYHGSQSPTAENNYAGTNRTRYRNPEYNALLDRYAATIPKPDRLQVLGQILHHMSDQLNIMGLFYDTETTAVVSRLKNVTPNAKELGTTAMWNVAQWEVN
jgi:ABC-type transport system substrate-binding protein